MSTTGIQQQDNEAAQRRLMEWGPFYLKATHEMYERARGHMQKDDFISAYLCLWVAFNNLYSLTPGKKEKEKIKMAVCQLPEPKVNELLSNQEYIETFRRLNERSPREAPRRMGVLDMGKFLRGETESKCVKHVSLTIPRQGDSIDRRRSFLAALTTELLYTVRNNLFHAIKDPQNDLDLEVVKHAYHLLDPLMEPLLGIAKSRLSGDQ